MYLSMLVLVYACACLSMCLSKCACLSVCLCKCESATWCTVLSTACSIFWSGAEKPCLCPLDCVSTTNRATPLASVSSRELHLLYIIWIPIKRSVLRSCHLTSCVVELIGSKVCSLDSLLAGPPPHHIAALPESYCNVTAQTVVQTLVSNVPCA